MESSAIRIGKVGNSDCMQKEVDLIEDPRIKTMETHIKEHIRKVQFASTEERSSEKSL